MKIVGHQTATSHENAQISAFILDVVGAGNPKEKGLLLTLHSPSVGVEAGEGDVAIVTHAPDTSGWSLGYDIKGILGVLDDQLSPIINIFRPGPALIERPYAELVIYIKPL